MACESTHGFDQVRDQIVALAQLHVDVGVSLIAALCQFDEAIIRSDASKLQDLERMERSALIANRLAEAKARKAG